MVLLKRKTLETRLRRRVRAIRQPSEDDSANFLNGNDYSTAPREQNSYSQLRTFKDLKEDSKVDISVLYSSGYDEYESTASELELAPAISFGVLAKAQAQLQVPKNCAKAIVSNIDGVKSSEIFDMQPDIEAQERKVGRQDSRDFNRSNKHAPVELSSKKAVSRRREVIPVVRREVRDPRFELLSGPLNESKIQQAYSFLDGYREDEMEQLRAAVKNTNNDKEKGKLKRALSSMESKEKAQDRKRRNAEFLSRHRKEEKELVKQGKKPFYLKKSELRKRVLVENYHGLKDKQLDHALERRRKKLEQKEKKRLPWARRLPEGQSR